MSDDKNKRLKPSSSNKVMSVQNVPEGSGDDIQDQIIIAPEIMKKVLEHLDLRNLKKVRLVCKSWLLEAQPHLERRGIGLLHESAGYSDSFQKVIKTREKNISALPPPFRSIDVCLGQPGSILLRWLVKQTENLNSPLMITRFTQGGVHLNLAIPLVTQHSSSLEYLMLSLQCTYGADAIPQLSPEKRFPNLLHLNVDFGSINFVNGKVIDFGSLIRDIVKASPKLECYEYASLSRNASQVAMSTLLMAGVDIRNVKTLKLSMDVPSALLRLGSITFRQLENLKIKFPRHSAPPLIDLALTTTLAKSATTLKTLNLLGYSGPAVGAGFPICPCVQELTLDSFPYSHDFLPAHFPSLQVLNVTFLDMDLLGGLWSLAPLCGLKTFRIQERVLLRGGRFGDQCLIRFLNAFPDLERVSLDYSFVMNCCRINATGDPQDSNLLGGVKHLELAGLELGFLLDDDPYSPFAALTGIETLTLVLHNENLVRFPFHDMISLKVLRFPWGTFPAINGLVNIARGLEKVVITNCCSFPRADGNSWPSKSQLDSFFDSAPNTECGCKDWKETSPEWN